MFLKIKAYNFDPIKHGLSKLVEADKNSNPSFFTGVASRGGGKSKLFEIASNGVKVGDMLDTINNMVLRFSLLDIFIDNERTIIYDRLNGDILINMNNVKPDNIRQIRDTLEFGKSDYKFVDGDIILDSDSTPHILRYDCSCYESIRDWESDITVKMFPDNFVQTPISMAYSKDIPSTDVTSERFKIFPTKLRHRAIRVLTEYHYFDVSGKTHEDLDLFLNGYDKDEIKKVILSMKDMAYGITTELARVIPKFATNADYIYNFFTKEAREIDGFYNTLYAVEEIFKDFFVLNIRIDNNTAIMKDRCSHRAALEALRSIRED